LKTSLDQQKKKNFFKKNKQKQKQKKKRKERKKERKKNFLNQLW